MNGIAEEFHEGLAVISVRRNNRSDNRGYGYIDRKGRSAIPPMFGEALSFSEGLAAVRKNQTTVKRERDKWGYIDKTGKYVIEPHYNEAKSFHKGTAKIHVGGTEAIVCDRPQIWEGGQSWLIDRKGRRLKRFYADMYR